MTMKIKRSKLAVFLNTGTADAAAYNLIGNGVASQTINYNPQTEEETYIHQDSGNTEVTGYKPTIPTPMTAIKGDPIFDYVDKIRRNRSILDDAKTTVCIVYLYEDAESGAYPAEECDCTVQIDDFGGDGGASAVINFTINLCGEPTQGTFDPTTKKFTAE